VLAVTACTSVPKALDDLDAATLDYLDTNAEVLARTLGIDDPPDVQPIRLITLSEWGSAQRACLNQAGYEVTGTSDGQGVSYPRISDPALKESLNLAIYTCELQYPVQQKYMTPLSTEGLELLYAYRTGELITCLENEGYGISAEPPSQTVFVQSDGMWSPFDAIAIAEKDLKRVFAACPQTPEAVYGN
jgi:hypothetical protein